MTPSEPPAFTSPLRHKIVGRLTIPQYSDVVFYRAKEALYTSVELSREAPPPRILISIYNLPISLSLYLVLQSFDT